MDDLLNPHEILNELRKITTKQTRTKKWQYIIHTVIGAAVLGIAHATTKHALAKKKAKLKIPKQVTKITK